MSLRLGRHNFTRVVYDEASDVLYASLPGADPSRREVTPEADTWLFDEDGRLIGVRVMEPMARWRREGAVKVSLPSGELERAAGIEAVLEGRSRI